MTNSINTNQFKVDMATVDYGPHLMELDNMRSASNPTIIIRIYFGFWNKQGWIFSQRTARVGIGSLYSSQRTASELTLFTRIFDKTSFDTIITSAANNRTYIWSSTTNSGANIALNSCYLLYTLSKQLYIIYTKQREVTILW